MLHNIVKWLANAMAFLGGGVLCVLVVLVSVSVTGRELNGMAHSGWFGTFGERLLDWGLGPITGDYELVEAGTAFAVFAFLPLTQLSGSHATVDIFTSGLSKKANHVISTFWSAIMSVAIVLISWQLFEAMQDKVRYRETSYLIQFPVWWAYAASLGAAITASVVSVYCLAMRFAGVRTL